MNFFFNLKAVYLFFILLLVNQAFAQLPDIKHVEPMHWWLGMKNPDLQLLIHGKGIASASVTVQEPGLQLRKVNKTTNPNYLFLDLVVAPQAKAGIYHIRFSAGGQSKTIDYELKAKSAMAPGALGYGPKDVLYLIMPDRFANGDPANDFVEGTLERPARTEPFGRHGGDLAGIEKNLDYIKDLGATTLWINPVLENNQPMQSYHGYSFTDLYKIDPRYGSLADYKRLTAACHQRGMKMVQDMVANHIGSKHWWMDDLPDADWVHPVGDPFNRSNFRIETVPDPHGASADRSKMVNGWFDIHMPDLNQRNPFLGKYLIQNSLWWIAEVGIDGIRMDTYPYNDVVYMSAYCDAILKEFPAFNIVGEVWVDSPALSAYFVKGALNRDGYKASLPTVTDFPLYFAITKGLMEKGSWDNGLQKVYNTVSHDYLYKSPEQNLIFLDNHDITRFYTSQKSDIRRFRQGIGMLLTMRGVPQLYYGTEILMTGDGAVHPEVRKDFPGGWPGDTLDLFSASARKGKVDSAFKFTQKLLQWRKTAPAMAEGKLTHYLPDSNVYVYFRHHPKQDVMVLVNGSHNPQKVRLKRFASDLGTMDMAKEISTDEVVDLKSEFITIEPHGIMILDCFDSNPPVPQKIPAKPKKPSTR